MLEPETKPAEAVEEAPKPPRVSVIVVSHNRRPMLRRCLDALERSEDRGAIQILVVDNGSRDGSSELELDFPNAQFIRAPKNFGLTKALNLGMRASTGEFIFWLHDDTEPAPSCVRLLVAALDAQADAAGACPLLVDDTGAPAAQLGALPPDGQWRPAASGGVPAEVEYASGAALMVRSFFLTGLRGIDERYGQFGADAELCHQIRRARRKLLLVPEARVVHTPAGALSAARAADFRLGVAAFLGKHFGVALGLKARAAAIFSALGGFRLGEFKYLVSGQKIDGTQPE